MTMYLLIKSACAGVCIAWKTAGEPGIGQVFPEADLGAGWGLGWKVPSRWV